MALRACWHKSCLPLFIFYLINWNNKWTVVSSGDQYLASCSNCSSREAILASRAAIVALNLFFTAPSISCSLLFSSLFCLSSCCRAFSFFCAVERSVASSLFSCSACKEGRNALTGVACFQTNDKWQFGKAVLQILRTTSSFCWNMSRKCCVLEWAVPAVLLSSCGHPLPLCCLAPLPALPPVEQFLPPGAVSHPEGLSWKFKFKKWVVLALTICYDCIMNCQ